MDGPLIQVTDPFFGTPLLSGEHLTHLEWSPIIIVPTMAPFAVATCGDRLRGGGRTLSSFLTLFSIVCAGIFIRGFVRQSFSTFKGLWDKEGRVGQWQGSFNLFESGSSGPVISNFLLI